MTHSALASSVVVMGVNLGESVGLAVIETSALKPEPSFLTYVETLSALHTGNLGMLVKQREASKKFALAKNRVSLSPPSHGNVRTCMPGLTLRTPGICLLFSRSLPEGAAALMSAWLLVSFESSGTATEGLICQNCLVHECEHKSGRFRKSQPRRPSPYQCLIRRA